MRKKLFIYLFFLGAILCSCKSSCDFNSLPETIDASLTSVGDDSMNSTVRCVNYVASNPELFGTNAIVFESPEQMFRELEELNEMDYQGLRAWQAEHDFYNPIMNSIIIHDSVQTAVLNLMGLNTRSDISEETGENLPIIDETLRNRAFTVYDRVMTNNYSQYVKTVVDSDGSLLLNPLGIMDEHVFSNEMGLYLCGGMVYKDLEDGTFECPYDIYRMYAHCTTLAQVNAIHSGNPSDFVKTTPNFAGNGRTNYASFDTLNTNYRMKVEFRVIAYGYGFIEWRQVSMNATNYHKNRSGDFRPFACETKITAHVSTQSNLSNSDWSNTFNTGWCPMKGGMTYYRLKAYSRKSSGPYLTHIDIDAQNCHGVRIIGDRNY